LEVRTNLSDRSLKLIGEEAEKHAVGPSLLDVIPPVGAKDSDPAEADGLVAADRARIRCGRVR